MSETTVIKAVSDKRDLNAFVKFPYKHYKEDPNFVPHLISEQKELLNPDKHPFYKHAEMQLFLALQNGKIVGRIAGIVDRLHNEVHNEKTGFFGFFESINDFDVAKKLLDSAREWVKSKGMEFFRGPLNPSQNEECGLLIDAFDSPPVIMMTYNPKYYIDLLEEYGLKKVMDLYAYYIDNNIPQSEKLKRVSNIIREKESITIRPLNMKNYENETNKIWEVYNNAWQKNFGFVPMTEEEFAHLAKSMKQIIVPDLALIAESKGKPIGFSVSLPDINQALIYTNGRLFPFGLFKLLWYSRKIDTIRIIIMGVIEEYQHKGIDSVFYLDTWNNAVKHGYWKGEMSWILENNKMMNRAAVMLGGKIYKTYRLYQMKA